MGDADTGGHLAMLRQEAALARFGETALRSDELGEILAEACRLAAEALGTGPAAVMELREDGASLVVRAGVGWDHPVVGVTVAAEGTAEGRALRMREPASGAGKGRGRADPCGRRGHDGHGGGYGRRNHHGQTGQGQGRRGPGRTARQARQAAMSVQRKPSGGNGRRRAAFRPATQPTARDGAGYGGVHHGSS